MYYQQSFNSIVEQVKGSYEKALEREERRSRLLKFFPEELDLILKEFRQYSWMRWDSFLISDNEDRVNAISMFCENSLECNRIIKKRCPNGIRIKILTF